MGVENDFTTRRLEDSPILGHLLEKKTKSVPLSLELGKMSKFLSGELKRIDEKISKGKATEAEVSGERDAIQKELDLCAELIEVESQKKRQQKFEEVRSRLSQINEAKGANNADPMPQKEVVEEEERPKTKECERKLEKSKELDRRLQRLEDEQDLISCVSKLLKKLSRRSGGACLRKVVNALGEINEEKIKEVKTFREDFEAFGEELRKERLELGEEAEGLLGKAKELRWSSKGCRTIRNYDIED